MGMLSGASLYNFFFSETLLSVGRYFKIKEQKEKSIRSFYVKRMCLKV